MIISEKQIMQLMTIAHNHVKEHVHRFGETSMVQHVIDLLNDIGGQQSEELKVIE